ncbi:MAG: hypothetical protein LBD61_05050, partial [Endomicrobium sp.]|nr:hypothetical protein [Endomicrobium sp.]
MKKKILCLIVWNVVVVCYYNISYAGKTVNIDVEVSSAGFYAANGEERNNYGTPFRQESNDNILNLNVTPGTNCYICGGAGKGEVFDFINPNFLLMADRGYSDFTNQNYLLGDVKENKLNIYCNVDDGCFFVGGVTSTGTVAKNSVNVYGAGGSAESLIFGGLVFCSGCVENNTVNIYNDFSGRCIVGGIGLGDDTGDSNFNIVNIFSSSNIAEHLWGGGVSFDGTCIGNKVDVYGSITMQGGELECAYIDGGHICTNGSAERNSVTILGTIQFLQDLKIYGGYVYNEGSSNGNSVNISGTIHSRQGLRIFGGHIGTYGYANGIASRNSVNISGSIESKENFLEIFGGYINSNGNATINSVSISGSIKSDGDLDIRGGQVAGDGIANNNRVNISGDIRSKKDLDIRGGEVKGNGIANGNSVNISGSIECEDNICIIGGGGTDSRYHIIGVLDGPNAVLPTPCYNSEGNVVSISGKIVSGGRVVIVGGSAYRNAVNNKVIILETAELPEHSVLYGGSLLEAGVSLGNCLEVS